MMISKQYFEETFSLSTAQALQAWADSNLIDTPLGDYGMKISYNGNATMFAETTITGLTIGNEYILKTDTVDILSNSYRTKINSLPNDNASMVAELPWGTGERELIFTATAETMYIAIGDENGSTNTYSIVDNISLKIDGVEAVSNGTFEAGDTTGWTSQNGGSTLEAYQYVAEPPLPGDNPYVETVVIPKYNASDTEHFLITSDADWDHINDADKTNFYVEPGVVTSGIKTITISGSASKRRTISLYNGNDEHPAKLNKSELSSFSLSFNNGSYWTLDRPCSFDNTIENALRFRGYATNNIVSRMYTDNIARSVQIRDKAYYNTIQYSRFTDMTHNARLGDKTCIEIVPYITDGTYECLGTKIILNEFKNQGDGIQLVSFWSSDGTEANGAGTVIDSNDIYFTDDIYTDGNGNYTPTGDYMYGENCLDFKFGSSDNNNPVIVTNNNMWGVRKADATNSQLSTSGSGVTIHFGAFNLHLTNNRIFDCLQGVGIGSKAGFTHAWSGSLSDNIFQDCGTIGGLSGKTFAVGSSRDALVQNNLISNGRGDMLLAQNNLANITLTDNLALDTPNDWVLSSNSSSGSTYTYHAANDNAGSYQEVTAASQGYTNDYTFTTDKYTNSPRVITLTNTVNP